MNAFTESVVEQAVLDWIQVLRRHQAENPVHENAAK